MPVQSLSQSLSALTNNLINRNQIGFKIGENLLQIV